LTRCFVQLVVALVVGVMSPWWAHAHGVGLHAAPDEPIKPLTTAPHGQDPARVALGRRLFHDVRLSGNDSVSCASCHDLQRGGVDRRDRSIGFDGQRTAVNAPTVFNAALNFKQFWNGRADSLEQQIYAVVQNPVEMGSKWDVVLVKLAREPGYRTAFATAYDDGMTRANVANAIATFERTLTTPNSRFDRFLRGDANAISAEEKAGYDKFKQYGCVSCHQGVNVGGNMFQKFGVMAAYFDKRGAPTEADLGRFLVTHDEADRNVFKVPSLRNVALTAPYFHDASARTLDDAVDVMFRYQLGRIPSAADKRAIVLFLNALTGEFTEQL
jgi:cytochrome c peroxidase